ncbi:MAG TPA: hypothetical protein EYP51_04485 [Thiotrichales bacterium]|nr:hypothetical protein [Thiotrichales bacterium]
MTHRFNVGSFNVRNLVPPSSSKRYHFFYDADRKNCYWDEGDAENSYYQRKINWLARQLERMNCDIVCFQEVFDLSALEDVINASRYAGSVTLYLAGDPEFTETEYEGVPAKIYTQPRIALMVSNECKLVEVSTLETFPDIFDLSRTVKEKNGRQWQLELRENGEYMNLFNRPVLKARIKLPKRFSNMLGVAKNKSAKITLFSAHLKSKRPIYSWPDSREMNIYARDYLQEYALGQARALLLRAVESAALRSYALDELARNPQQPLLVVGDLNDGPRSITTDIAGGLSQPRIGLSGKKDRLSYTMLDDLSADMALYSSYHLQTRRTHRDVYFTHIYDGFHDSLDHVLVSSHFVPKWLRDGHGRDSIGKVGTLRVFNDHLLNSELDDLHSKKVGKFFHTRSDHGQLSVRIDWFERGQKNLPVE